MLSIKGLVSVSWPRAEPNPEMLKLTATPKNEARKALKEQCQSLVSSNSEKQYGENDLVMCISFT